MTAECISRLMAIGISHDDAAALRRIAMTLHRWHELECNEDVTRGEFKRVNGAREFAESENGATYIRRHLSFNHRASFIRIPDREAGARKRLAKIMARYPSLIAYVQTDPRGAALYILRPGDVPEGASVGSYYSRGIAVYK